VSFLLTSTDTAVRLGRYMMEEIVGAPTTSIQTVASDRFGNAFMQGIIAYVLIGSGSWATLWQLFGGANQLLAALALLTATVWLANWDDTKQLISTGVPMAIMVVITVSGLLWLALHSNLYSKFLNPEWMATRRCRSSWRWCSCTWGCRSCAWATATSRRSSEAAGVASRRGTTSDRG
jgi:carbon starvation protein